MPEHRDMLQVMLMQPSTIFDRQAGFFQSQVHEEFLNAVNAVDPMWVELLGQVENGHSGHW